MKLIHSISFAIVYTIFYGFFAFASFGAGHGIFIYFAPFYPWIFLFAAIVLLGKLEKSFVRKVFIGLMCVHYAGSLFFLFLVLSWEDFKPDMSSMWGSAPSLIIIPGVIYFLGQTIIWILFLKSSALNKHDVSKTNNSLP